MTITSSHRSSLGLAVGVFLLLPNAALSGGTAETIEEKDEENRVPYSITGPASRHAFSSEILDKMRKDLMRLMGVEEPVDSTQASSH